jgi:hypothetical protein
MDSWIELQFSFKSDLKNKNNGTLQEKMNIAHNVCKRVLLYMTQNVQGK